MTRKRISTLGWTARLHEWLPVAFAIGAGLGLGLNAPSSDAAGANSPARNTSSSTQGAARDTLQSRDAAAPQTIELTVGAQQPLAGGHQWQRVAIGDPGVADVLIIRGERSERGTDRRGGVLLIGKAPGTTSLMLWERNRDAPVSYTVRVVPAAARALLGPDTPSVDVTGKTALIAGTASTMQAHQRAVAVAEDAVGAKGNGVDTSTIATRSVVQVDVRVVEFSRSVLKQAGFFFRQNNGFSFGGFGPNQSTSVTRLRRGSIRPRRRRSVRRSRRRCRRRSISCSARRRTGSSRI